MIPGTLAIAKASSGNSKLGAEDAYLLGVFDGEGCVTTCRNTCGQSISVHVQVTMGSETITKLLAERFGGRAIQRSKPTAGGLRLWVWRITGHKAQPFLEIVRDHSLTKSKQARLALRILDLTMQGPRGNRRLGAITIDARERLSDELRSLNGGRSRFGGT